MTISEMHTSFKLELDKTSSLELPAYEPEEIDFWLVNAIRKFVKTRYSGLNVKGESFEQSQKRIDDLRTLVVDESLACASGGTIWKDSYTADLSTLTERYWFTLSENVLIAFTSYIDSSESVASGDLIPNSVYIVIDDAITYSGDIYDIGEYFVTNTALTYTGSGSAVLKSSSVEPVKEATADNYNMLLQNPYSEHRLHYEKASPLRLFLGNKVELITDGNYAVILYNIRYLKQPRRVNILTTAYTAGSSDIKDGITYLVSTNTVTYNGVTYSPAQTFIGVSGVSTFTGSGTATAQKASCDLPEHTHDEVVRLAVNMALENIEQPRYQSHMNEIITME